MFVVLTSSGRAGLEGLEGGGPKGGKRSPNFFLRREGCPSASPQAIYAPKPRF
jgi:hypothetical protein